jgi:hypothetical protein
MSSAWLLRSLEVKGNYFSIAKPIHKNAIQHRLLRQFILEHALSSGPEERKSPPEPGRGPVPADIRHIGRYVPAELFGREAETKFLNDAWTKAQNNETERPRILTFVALGGEGKTSLVAKWAAELAHQDWPGCDAVFAWSFYNQGTREHVAASSDLFLKEALTSFGDPEIAGSALGPLEKGWQLARLTGENGHCSLSLVWSRCNMHQPRPAESAPMSVRPDGRRREPQRQP